MKKSLNFIQHVVKNLKLNFGSIWMKGIKRSLRIVNERVTLFYSKRCWKPKTKIRCNLVEVCKKVLKDN